MGKVKRLELWWQLYRTSLPERDLRSIRPMDFCSTECTTFDTVVLYLLLYTAYFNNTQTLIFLMWAHYVLWETGSKGKVKVKFAQEQTTKTQGEYRYSCTLSLTSALDGGGCSTPRPGRFTPWKETRYPLYRRLGGPQGRTGRAQKISPPPVFNPRTVQPVATAIPTELSRRTGRHEADLSV